MTLNEAIDYRQSVRSFQENRQVSRDQIERIVAAAQKAPSWRNYQVPRYHVAMSPEAVAQVRETCLPEFNQRSTQDASAFVVCSFVKNKVGFTDSGKPTNEGGQGWGWYDMGLQNENLMLAAADEQIDSLVMGARDEDALRVFFDIPATEAVGPVIALGWRAEQPDRKPRPELSEIMDVR